MLDELLGIPKGLSAVGISPAYEGEDIGTFAAHPWLVRNAAKSYTSVGELLTQAASDVLVVSTRPDHIQPTALMGLKAGCHLILEKPLTLDREALEALYLVAKSRGRRVMAMLSMRAVPAFVAARKLVQDGDIGHPVLVNTRKSYKWGVRPDWFNERRSYGGTWPWIGIHNLDMANFVTGLDAVSVFASHANAVHPFMSGCEDACAAVFMLQGGVQMTASVDICRPDSAPTWGDDWIRVVGSEGVLEANGSTGRLSLITSTRNETIPYPAEKGVPIYREFLASLDKPEFILDATAFKLTAAVLAARESADTGKEVHIEPGPWDESVRQAHF